jgi:hypothetical protein
VAAAIIDMSWNIVHGEHNIIQLCEAVPWSWNMSIILCGPPEHISRNILWQPRSCRLDRRLTCLPPLWFKVVSTWVGTLSMEITTLLSHVRRFHDLGIICQLYFVVPPPPRWLIMYSLHLRWHLEIWVEVYYTPGTIHMRHCLLKTIFITTLSLKIPALFIIFSLFIPTLFNIRTSISSFLWR